MFYKLHSTPGFYVDHPLFLLAIWHMYHFLLLLNNDPGINEENDGIAIELKIPYRNKFVSQTNHSDIKVLYRN